jgi:hypothetical protein
MIVKEYHIKPEPYQEIEVPIGSRPVNAVVKDEGHAVLIVEVEDDNERPDYLAPETETIGLYIVKTDDEFAEEIDEDYMYLTTLKMASELGVLLFHLYVQDPDFYLAEAEDRLPKDDEGNILPETYT